jgi:branched-chain amino acid transport system ATP-binding protein
LNPEPLTMADAAHAEDLPGADPVLSINNIEVIYDHVILVLKGVSLEVPQGGIVRCWGQTAQARRPRSRRCRTCCKAERGQVTKGSITFKGEARRHMNPNDLVRRGCIQVMEGRHCFGHLNIEENLLTGAFTRKDGRAEIARDLEMVYNYFPRLRERRTSLAGYTSGGEQQMCAIGRALMSGPTDHPCWTSLRWGWRRSSSKRSSRS